MNTLNTFGKIFLSFALFGVLLFGAWFSLDLLSPGSVGIETAEAFVDCVGCAPHVDGGGGGFGNFGGFGGFGGGGGEGGGGGGGGGTLTTSCTLYTLTPTLSGSGTVTLNWVTLFNATSFSINNGVGSVTPVGSGSTSVYVDQTTTFVGTVVKGTETKTCTVTVTVTPPQDPPVCTLDLTQNNISWTSNHANTVTIVPLTNSPAVPGATGGGGAGGTTVISIDFGTLVAQYKTALQQSVGGFVIDGFYADKATADKICSVIAPGTVNGTYQSDDYSSPKNNTVLLWNGTSWNQFNAKNYNKHFRYNFTCVTASNSAETYPLSGLQNFVPPLGVGTHTYLLTATGPGGSAQCQQTVVIPPPPPANGCIKIKKETFDTVGNPLFPVAQFTFKLDGGPTVTTDANGDAVFTNVTPGVHTVTELDAGSAWELVSVTPANGVVNVPPGSTCAAVVFKNKQVLPPPPGDPVCQLTLTKEQLTWNTTNVSSVVIVPLTTSPTVGVNLPVDGSKVFNPVLGPGVHTYKLTGTGPTNKTVTCQKTIEVPSPEAPNCTLTANKTSISAPGEAVELSYTAQNIVQAVFNSITVYQGGSQDFSGTYTVNPTQTTTYTGVVTGASGETKTCSVTITYTPTTPSPQCTLTLNKSVITTGESVNLAWTSSNATKGFISPAVGTTSPVSAGFVNDLFPSDTTTYTGTFSGPYGTTTCSASVTVNKGPGGCQGNCGGGLNQPNVSLAKAPGGQVLAASVSLAQVPYTGFEAGPLLTMLFWLSVIAWSFGMTYVVLGKQSMRFVAGKLVAFAHPAQRREDNHEEDGEYVEFEDPKHFEAVHEPIETHYSAQTMPAIAPIRSITPTVMTPPPPQRAPVGNAVDGIPSLTEVLESRAHATGILLSPEALAVALSLSSDRAELLSMFGDVLNEAVRTIPREDGWILLTSDRMDALVKGKKNETLENVAAPAFASVPTLENQHPVAPEAAVAESASEQLVASIVTSNRDAAFRLIQGLEHAQTPASKIITDAIALLDGIYHARSANAPFSHVALLEKSQAITETKLASAIEMLTNALTARYSNPFTGFKIALAQVFDL